MKHTMQNKKRLCILFGGQSSEHDVSLVSASFVMEMAQEAGFDVLPVGITKDGKWRLFHGSSTDIRERRWLSDDANERCALTPDREIGGLLVFDEQTGYRVEKIDCIFPVLHGRCGEDGTMQGLFDLCGIPYVGCGLMASALAMDKVYAKVLFDAACIPQTEWCFVELESFIEQPLQELERIEAELAYPVFVKPANAGSSVGISKATDANALQKALQLAFLHDDKAVIEAAVDGREIEVAVLGSRQPIVSVAGEIIPEREFYDYTAKYEDDRSRLVIPADLSDTVYEEIKKPLSSPIDSLVVPD